MPDKFSSKIFDQHFSHQAGKKWELVVLAETESTMNIARERARSGTITQPFMAIASSQSGGRGRQGRVWHSGPGGFYATFMFATGKAMADLGGFSLVVGVVIRRILESHSVNVQLKWPNDLVSPEGRKLGGILIEVLPVTGDSLLLTGTGVNFDNTVDPAMATTVREMGAGVLTLPQFAAQLGEGLDQALTIFNSHGLSSFLKEWREADYLRGRQIKIDDAGRELNGTVQGISDQGALLLEVNGELRELWSGHIVSISGVDRS